MTHAAHIAHSMANHALDKVGQEFSEINGINLDGVFQVGVGTPSKAGIAISELKTSQVLSGMKRHGPFSQLIAHGLLVWIYTLWDAKYRREIARELDVETQAICCDVMGDLRYIRNWIVHSNCFANDDYKKLKILKWPDKRGEFVITGSRMDEFQLAINTMDVYLRQT